MQDAVISIGTLSYLFVVRPSYQFLHCGNLIDYWHVW